MQREIISGRVHGNAEKAGPLELSHKPYYFSLRIKIPIKLPQKGGREA